MTIFYSDVDPLSKYSPVSMLHIFLAMMKTLASGNSQSPTLSDSLSKSFIMVNDAFFVSF